jgi:membrane protease YdiL (CAAX protease family)
MGKQWEFLQPKPYPGRREGAIALLACTLWFGAIVLRRSEFPDWSATEILFEASSFAVFAGIPVFFLATSQGERLAQRILLPRQGLAAQGILCAVLGAYLSIGHGLRLSSEHFPWLEVLNRLFVPEQFGLNTALFLGGVFVAARIPFVALTLRRIPLHWRDVLKARQLVLLLLLNTLYLSLRQTGTSLEGLWVGLIYGLVCLGMSWVGWPKRSSGDRLFPSDFFLMMLCVGIIYHFSTPSFSFGVFIAVNLFILVLIYGTGLGRVHFGYSFQMRRADWKVLVQMMVIAASILVPLALFSGFVQPERVGRGFSLLKIVSYFVLFTFRVGIFEEIFFRSGVMVLLRDQLQHSKRQYPPQFIAGLSALGCSVLFGLAHIGNQAGDSHLAPWVYATIYIGLATIASLCYALTFARTNCLAPPILVHGFVDTTAVLLLGGFLSVPF